jgi:hypothetical protein
VRRVEAGECPPDAVVGYRPLGIYDIFLFFNLLFIFIFIFFLQNSFKHKTVSQRVKLLYSFYYKKGCSPATLAWTLPGHQFHVRLNGRNFIK